MRVIDRVADVEEPAEQLAERDPPRRPAAPAGRPGFRVRAPVKVPDRRRQALAADEPHRVVEPALGVAAQAVDRDDPGMLQVARDLGLDQEPRALFLAIGEPGQDHLQGHLALELAIPGHPDLADPAACMGPDRHEAVPRRESRWPRRAGRRYRVPRLRRRLRLRGPLRRRRSPGRPGSSSPACPQGVVAHLRQHLDRQPLRDPAPPGTAGGRCCAVSDRRMRAARGRGGDRRRGRPRPRASGRVTGSDPCSRRSGRWKGRARDRVGDERQDGHEHIAIPIVHAHPPGWLPPARWTGSPGAPPGDAPGRSMIQGDTGACAFSRNRVLPSIHPRAPTDPIGTGRGRDSRRFGPFGVGDGSESRRVGGEPDFEFFPADDQGTPARRPGSPCPLAPDPSLRPRPGRMSDRAGPDAARARRFVTRSQA